MHQASVKGSNPVAPIVIAQKSGASGLTGSCGEQNGAHELSISKAHQPATPWDIERSIVLREALDAGRLPCKWVKFRRAGVPSPESIQNAGPKLLLSVFVQPEHALAKRAVLTVAADRPMLTAAPLARRRLRAAPGPSRP